MMRILKAVTVGFLLAMVLSDLRASSPLYGDAVIAVVEGEVITVYDLQEAVRQEEAELRSLYRGDELRQKLMELRKEVADRLVERELVHAEFKALGAKVPIQALQDRMDRMIVARAGGDRRRFEDLLAREGLTYSEYEARMAKALAVDLLINERVLRHIEVGPREVERFYAERGSELASQPGYHLLTIVLRKEGGRHSDTLAQTVKDIQQKLAGGARFADLAREYSESPRAEAGGDEGWIASPSGRLQEAIAGLAVGQVTPEPVDLGSSLYFIKLKDRREGGVPPLTNDLRQRIEDRLREEQRDTRLKAFIKELRAKYFVKAAADFMAADAPSR